MIPRHGPILAHFCRCAADLYKIASKDAILFIHHRLWRHLMDDGEMDPKIEVCDSLETAKHEFGENYGAYVFRLTRAQIEALLQGRVVAFDISDGEYAGFLLMGAETNP